MRRRFLIPLCVLMLACAGIGETIIEQATGGDVTLMEEGMDLVLPDGSQFQIRWGSAATHAPEIPFSPPIGLLSLSGVASIPGSPESHFVLYQCNESADELIQKYKLEMEAMGLTPNQTVPEPGAIHLQAERDGMTYIVSVDEAENGTRNLTLGVGDLEAIEQGLQQQPG